MEYTALKPVPYIPPPVVPKPEHRKTKVEFPYESSAKQPKKLLAIDFHFYGDTNPYIASTPESAKKQIDFYKSFNFSTQIKYIKHCLENKVWLAKDGVVHHVTAMSSAHLHNTINYIERRIANRETCVFGLGPDWLPILIKETERRLEKEGI